MCGVTGIIAVAMSHSITIEPQTPVDAAVETPDVVEVPLEPAPTTEATVVTRDGPAVTVEHEGTGITATAQPAPVTDALVTAPQTVEAQVVTSGFITIVQDGGEPGFVDWAEYIYTDTGINLVKTINAGQIVTEVKLTVLETFDGSPSLQVGSAADPDLWLDLGALELSVLCEYHNESLLKFAVAEQILLTLSAPGSTRGRVALLYRMIG